MLLKKQAVINKKPRTSSQKRFRAGKTAGVTPEQLRR